jgi:hypothetical protein
MRKFLLLKLVSLMLIGTCHGLTKIDALAHAIARTEGFYIKGTIPNRLHNPGDITSSLPHAYEGQTRTYRGYAVFKSDTYGWAALKGQIAKVIDGSSTKYTSDMTFAQIAKVYAQDPRWGRTVCKILQISPSLTFAEYFDMPPRVWITENYAQLPLLWGN